MHCRSKSRISKRSRESGQAAFDLFDSKPHMCAIAVTDLQDVGESKAGSSAVDECAMLHIIGRNDSINPAEHAEKIQKSIGGLDQHTSMPSIHARTELSPG
eukprot:516764-Amphidinium_carterae.1